jgi:hypothetical protein
VLWGACEASDVLRVEEALVGNLGVLELLSHHILARRNTRGTRRLARALLVLHCPLLFIRSPSSSALRLDLVGSMRRYPQNGRTCLLNRYIRSARTSATIARDPAEPRRRPLIRTTTVPMNCRHVDKPGYAKIERCEVTGYLIYASRFNYADFARPTAARHSPIGQSLAR